MTGDFLYYANMSDYTQPTADDMWHSYVYEMTDRLMCVPLREDVEWPHAPESDEEEWEDEEEEEPPPIIPEPGTAALLVLGLALLEIARRRPAGRRVG